MPLYSYMCSHCEKEEDKFVKYEDRENQKCSECGLDTKYIFSGKFIAKGLPNGFAYTRSRSRGK